METSFLDRISYKEALVRQVEAEKRVNCGLAECVILGFEPEAVVTLGIRGDRSVDLLVDDGEFFRRGFSIEQVDRGGQATIHGPGQLVIFPICPMRRLGVKRWIERLARSTEHCLTHFGVTSYWDDSKPGLYTSKGKIVACGVRIRKGLSTHGLSININNDLSDFNLIRSCGMTCASADRMKRDDEPQIDIRTVFANWTEKFQDLNATDVDKSNHVLRL